MTAGELVLLAEGVAPKILLYGTLMRGRTVYLDARARCSLLAPDAAAGEPPSLFRVTLAAEHLASPDAMVRALLASAATYRNEFSADGRDLVGVVCSIADVSALGGRETTALAQVLDGVLSPRDAT